MVQMLLINYDFGKRVFILKTNLMLWLATSVVSYSNSICDTACMSQSQCIYCLHSNQLVFECGSMWGYICLLITSELWESISTSSKAMAFWGSKEHGADVNGIQLVLPLVPPDGVQSLVPLYLQQFPPTLHQMLHGPTTWSINYSAYVERYIVQLTFPAWYGPWGTSLMSQHHQDYN